MTRKVYKQTSFNAGELTPLIYSRIDIDKYDNGLKTGTNCYVTPQGPVKRRNGSKVIASTKSNSSTQALVKFQFNVDTNYTLEFGNQYIRFYDESSQIQSGGSPYEISSPYSASEVQNITYVQDGDTLYLAHPSYEPRVLTRTSDTSWSLTTLNALTPATYEAGYDPNVTITPNATTGLAKEMYAGLSSIRTSSFQWTASGSGTDEYYLEASGGGDPSITEPVVVTENGDAMTIGTAGTLAAGRWDWADNDSLGFSTVYVRLTDGADPDSKATDYVQQSSADVFLEADIGRQVKQDSGNGRASITAILTTASVTVDILEDYDDTSAIAAGSWYLDLSPISELTSNGSSPGSIVTITSDNIGTTTNWDTFRSSDIGKYIRMNSGIVKITELTNAYTVKGEVIKGLTSLSETDDWTLESDSWDSTRGYPRAVTLYQNRLWFGGTVAQPQTLWASETGLYDKFGVGTADDDALEVTLSSNVAAQINWIVSSRDLIVGTSGAEHTISGSTTGTAITPTNIKQVPRTYIGSNTQTPVVVGSEVLFISKSQRKIRSFRYDFNIDGYVSEDLFFLAEHLVTSDIVNIAYSVEPFSQLYVTLSGGDILTASYVRAQQVIGWTTYTTDGDYKYVQTISNGANDDLWVIVERDVNGTATTYIERFDTGTGSDAADIYSDGAVVYTGSETTITGITQANPGVVTANSHGLSNGNRVKLVDVSGMTEVNNTTYIVANKTSNTFELTTLQGANVNTTSYSAYTSGGSVYSLFNSINDSSLAPLEGESAQLKVDNAVHANKTVSSNTVSLDYYAHEVVLGRSFTTTIIPLSQNIDVGFGPMRNQRSRHVDFSLEVYQSAAPTVDGIVEPLRSSANNMDESLALYSGFLNYGQLGWGLDYFITISQSSPLPLTLLGIFSVVEGGLK